MPLPTDITPSGDPVLSVPGVIDVWQLIEPQELGRVQFQYVVMKKREQDEEPHTHGDEGMLLIVDRGSAVLRIGDDERTVGPGDVLWNPPGVPHSSTIISDELGCWAVVFNEPAAEHGHDHGNGHSHG